MKKQIYTVSVELDKGWFYEPYPESYTNKRLAKKRAYELYKEYKILCSRDLIKGFCVFVSPYDVVNECWVYTRRG